MELIVSGLVGLASFIFLIILLPRLVPGGSGARTKEALDRIAAGASTNTPLTDYVPGEEEQAIKKHKDEATGLAKILLSLPGAEGFYSLMLKAGHGMQAQTVVIGMFAL